MKNIEKYLIYLLVGTASFVSISLTLGTMLLLTRMYFNPC